MSLLFDYFAMIAAAARQWDRAGPIRWIGAQP